VIIVVAATAVIIIVMIMIVIDLAIPSAYIKKHKFPPLFSCRSDCFVVFTAVTMKNAVFWDVAPSRSCVNRRFGGTYRLHLQGRKIRERGTSVSRWLQVYMVPHPRRWHSSKRAVVL
jgi:hypothetical protein